jgi:uncharacterized protein (TIGR04255 family)
MVRLPTALEREPLIDALFEVRLSDTTSSLADLLPGLLFRELQPRLTIARLPASDIPLVMRTSDPGLQYQPVLRLDWGQYLINVSDRSFVVACKLPYPKWPRFKQTILDVVTKAGTLGLEGNVERYSIKYVNLITAETMSAQIAKIKMSVDLGSIHVTSDHINLQVHHVTNDTTQILTVVSGAEVAKHDGTRMQGIIVDVDSIRNIKPVPFMSFSSNLEPELESLRLSNKEMFFSCLTEATIAELGPTYE